MQPILKKSLQVVKYRHAPLIQIQIRTVLGGSGAHGDSTLGKADKAAFLLEDLRKARDMIEDMQKEHAESRVVFHEAHKSLQNALQQSHHDMRDLITSHSQAQGETVENLKNEVNELKQLVQELLKNKKDQA